VRVEVDGGAILVGVVAPVAELGGGEQGVLGAGVAGFAAHDQAGVVGPIGQVDQVGELRDLGAVAPFAVLAAGRCPTGRVGLGVGPRDRCAELGVGPGDHRKADVARPATVHEPLRAPGRVGAHHHPPVGAVRVLAGRVPGGDLGS
jgi:hypothetical protein